MEREFSGGGVLVRRLRGRWYLAAIRPGGKPEGGWALPKGLIGRGEGAEPTALREAEAETCPRGRPPGTRGDGRYVYARRGARGFQGCRFYLVPYTGGY